MDSNRTIRVESITFLETQMRPALCPAIDSFSLVRQSSNDVGYNRVSVKIARLPLKHVELSLNLHVEDAQCTITGPS